LRFLAFFYFQPDSLFCAPMLTTLRKAEYAELMILFFIQAAAMAIWFVPLGTILDAHGMNAIKPFAFAANAVAAFISPLMFGAMADRHVAPANVLRWLACATGITMAIIATAINKGCNPWLVLALIQIFSLSYAPMFSISTALVLARLENAQKEFGPVRALATFGWMCGALLVGLLTAWHTKCILARASGCSSRDLLIFCPRWKFPNPPSIFRGTNGSVSTR
jgi:MFS family permease